MILAVHVHVVHIQMQQAARFLHHLANKSGLIHFGPFGGCIVTGIFNADLLAQKILHLGNACGHMTHGFMRGRQWQQIVQMPLVPTPRQMFGIERNPVGAHESLHLGQQLHVQPVTAAQIQRQPMTGQRPELADGRQIPRKAPAQPTPVFGCHLEKGHLAQLATLQPLQRIGQQAATQPQTGTMQPPHLP